MGKVVRCKECGKSWEFSESKTRICTCGHRMEVKAPKYRGRRGLTSISTNPRFERTGFGTLNGQRRNSNWNYNWLPNVHRKSPRIESAVSKSSAYSELKKQLWKELEELAGWAKEGLKIRNGMVEELEYRLRKLKSM